MSAAGASTSQHPHKESVLRYGLYELCLLGVRDGVYRVGYGGLNSCIDPDAGICQYGPAFKAADEIDSPLRMVKNCEHHIKSKIRIKICDIDQDQLHNFENAMLSFNEDNELFRSKEDKSPGNFMRAAWEHAWEKKALYQTQYDTGRKIFDVYQGIVPPGWPASTEEGIRLRILAYQFGGMIWVFDEPPVKFLERRRVNLDPNTKEVTLLSTEGETSDPREGPLSN